MALLNYVGLESAPACGGMLLNYAAPMGAAVAPVVDQLPTLGVSTAGLFPTQYLGLKAYFRGAVQDLCLVAVADAPTGMGAVWKVLKGGTNYAVYLVETTDPNATPLYIRTTTGTKAVRIKT